MSKRKEIAVAASLGVVLVLGVELFARYGLGLGDPPLSIPDTEIDYVFAPNQDCRRFGNRIVYNDCSMRCDFDVNGGNRPEERIFVVGDSVVNGGVLTDHGDLATTILQERMDATRKNIQVCNVSAGSWGPGNYAAYFRKYRNLIGTNDTVIIEVNSHDLWEDDPKKTGGANVGKDISLPDQKPWCATWDGFDRYFMPKMRKWLGKAQVNTKVDVPKWGNDVENKSAKYNLARLDEIYALPWARKYLLIHRSQLETHEDCETPGETAFRKYASGRGITIIDLKLNDGDDFRDAIHQSESGQRKMADAIADVICCAAHFTAAMEK